MVIENQLYGDYDMEMLKRNRLPGFLPIKQIEADGAWQSWYEITGLQMLDEYMKQKPVDYELLKRMVLQIDTCMQLAEEYLLVVDDISLAPERTGIRPETGELYFCYLKGENKNSARQFQNLIEQILPNVDHRDRRAVEAVYAIYEIVLMEYFDFADVKKVFTQKDETAENMEENGQMVAEDTVFGMKEETEKPIRFYTHGYSAVIRSACRLKKLGLAASILREMDRLSITPLEFAYFELCEVGLRMTDEAGVRAPNLLEAGDGARSHAT